MDVRRRPGRDIGVGPAGQLEGLLEEEPSGKREGFLGCHVDEEFEGGDVDERPVGNDDHGDGVHAEAGEGGGGRGRVGALREQRREHPLRLSPPP